MSAIGSPRSGPRDRSWDARCLVESNTCERRDGKQDWVEVEIKLPCRLAIALAKLAESSGVSIIHQCVLGVGPKWPSLYFLTLPSPLDSRCRGKGDCRTRQLPAAEQMLKKVTAGSSLLTAVYAAGQLVFPWRGIRVEHLHVYSKRQTSRWLKTSYKP